MRGGGGARARERERERALMELVGVGSQTDDAGWGSKAQEANWEAAEEGGAERVE